MSEVLKEAPAGRLSGRTREEITRDFKKHCQSAAENILLLGYDLVEIKELLPHGEWLEWLSEMGWKERTAQNYMRVAKAWNENPSLMRMGYARTVALLAAPEEVQAQAAQGALDDASAAEIKRLTKEVKAAQEARKAAENKAAFYESATGQERESKLKAYEQIEDLKKQLNEKPAVQTVEVAPADYELIKRQLRAAEDAAQEAEERADRAVAAAQEAMPRETEEPFEGVNVIRFVESVNAFLSACGHLVYAVDTLRTFSREDRQHFRMFTDSVWHWAENMEKALDEADQRGMIPAEGGAVV